MRFRNIKKHSKHAETKIRPKYVYATYPQRIKAFITDLFMIYAPILYVIAYVVMNGKDDFQSSQAAPLLGVTLYGLIYAVLIGRFGQTPGKKAYEIKVVDDKSGEYIGFFRALWRFFLFLFTATTMLGLFLPLYRKDKKALHDLLCGTLVVTQMRN